MRFKFDSDQEFQLEAIDSIVDLFIGQRRSSVDLKFELGNVPAVSNELDIDDKVILENLKLLQLKNGVFVDDELRKLEGEYQSLNGKESVEFPNFTVEMETGTGKTYVYIRTALELFKRYGFRKFMIVVPSVAIREGVLKTLQVTKEHFVNLYENTPYRFYKYDSANLSQVRQFALSDSVEFMVMTLQSFNQADFNVIYRSSDRLQGEVPINMVQATRPILILDEPQNMESEKSIAALAAVKPLFALRYSATHRYPYNLVYRLTPAEAYRQGLVKRIEVNAVALEDQINRPYIRLNWVKSEKMTIRANVTIHKLFASGQIKESKITVKPGDSLQEKAGGRIEYRGYDIDEIDISYQSVRFANMDEMEVGEEIGADKEEIFRTQIYTTVEEHIRKQAKIHGAKVKVLSLFFIDRVDNYALDDGIIRKLFDESFETLKSRWPAWKDVKPEEVREGYFAARTTRAGETIFEDSKTGRSAKDRAAYRLIMQEKERLLSFEEPVSFIFSHSALREGWDNPNIFQICTLNQSVSDMRKRQEIGRGVRLSVNQDGERQHDEKLNVLTVVANESYESFVEDYQSEISEEYRVEIENRYGKKIKDLTIEERKQVEKEYGDVLPQKPEDARKRKAAQIQSYKNGKPYVPKKGEKVELHPDFEALWDKIKQKTRYAVTVDTENLIKNVVLHLQDEKIPRPRVTITKARVDINSEDAFEAMQMSAAKTLVSLQGRFPLPNLVEVMGNLMEHTTPPMRLTRKTLLEIIKQAPDQDALIENPNEFALRAVAIIKEQLGRQLIEGIKYQKIDDWYAMELFQPEIETWKEHLEPTTKSFYSQAIVDSKVEREFVRQIEKQDDVRFYIKLPAWFKVPTPIGNYNPDWAIVMDDPETGEEKIYLITETKGTADPTKLRFTHEGQKVMCGRAHFEGALNVPYVMGKSAKDIDGYLQLRKDLG